MRQDHFVNEYMNHGKLSLIMNFYVHCLSGDETLLADIYYNNIAKPGFLYNFDIQ